MTVFQRILCVPCTENCCELVPAVALVFITSDRASRLWVGISAELDHWQPLCHALCAGSCWTALCRGGCSGVKYSSAPDVLREICARRCQKHNRMFTTENAENTEDREESQGPQKVVHCRETRCFQVSAPCGTDKMNLEYGNVQ